MSSSFLSALSRAKENTKQMVNNASSHLSVKLQMNVNSSPPTCNKYPSITSSKGDNLKSEKPPTDTQLNLSKEINVSHDESISNGNGSIKYSDPLMVSKSREVPIVSSSDFKEFINSKSTESVF